MFSKREDRYINIFKKLHLIICKLYLNHYTISCKLGVEMKLSGREHTLKLFVKSVGPTPWKYAISESREKH